MSKSNLPSPFGAFVPRHQLPGYRSEVWPKAESYSYLCGMQKVNPYLPDAQRDQWRLVTGKELACGGWKNPVKGFHTVSHNMLAPHFWCGQVVAVFDERPMFSPFAVVHVDGLEVVCKLEEQDGAYVIGLSDDERESASLVVAKGDPDFMVVGYARSNKTTGAGHGVRAQIFWPSFSTTAN